uniref:Anaphase-promoting complex subunit 7 n=2 Tax=Kalanchoe fedtschenkoi TaxID=63787 RepID=A0A7N0TKA7_KALFE
MEVHREQITYLLDHGLNESAQTLGSFLVSSSPANAEVNLQLKAETLVLIGDALYQEREFHRAIHKYRKALQLYKTMPKQISNTRTSMSTSNRSSSPSNVNTSVMNENEVKFKIASSYCKLKETREALIEMEGIPAKARNLQMNLLLGRLYRITKHNRSAIACYKDCLRHCPYIFEAITALAELGCSAKDIVSLFPQTPMRSGRPLSDCLDSSRWLQRYVEAFCCIASNDYTGGLEVFTELLQRFPNNVHILLEVAKVEAVIGKNDDAIMNFEKARSIDPYVVTYMDEPEVSVALSVLWETKDDRRALTYAEKSIQVDERHVPGYIVKGYLLLATNRPEAAVAAFRGAQELRPDLRSYQGLVRSYLALSKLKEALSAARDFVKAMPHSAKATKLVGDVYASHSGSRDKAKKYYESALRLEPGFLEAALALAELHKVEGRLDDALSLLSRYLKDCTDDSLHVKLAQVYATKNMLQAALSHYQSALRLNPQNEAAKKGLERLEKQMKGLDPDAPEDDEENDVDDADIDQDD